MLAFFHKNKLYVLGAILGALAGYAYWYYVGCASGTCSITSRPLNSTLYGGLMGTLFLGMFVKDQSSNKNTESNI